MQLKIPTVLRYAISAAAAVVLVLGASGAMLQYLDRPKPDPLPGMVRAVQLTKSTDINLDALLSRDHDNRQAPERPKAVQPPGREIHGFVQLSYRVNPDGSVSNVKVLGSVPEGVYDQQAKKIIESRMYTPDFDADGNARAREDTDVIQFTIPADRVTPDND